LKGSFSSGGEVDVERVVVVVVVDVDVELVDELVVVDVVEVVVVVLAWPIATAVVATRANSTQTPRTDPVIRRAFNEVLRKALTTIPFLCPRGDQLLGTQN
jgi:hypothetical protein